MHQLCQSDASCIRKIEAGIYIVFRLLMMALPSRVHLYVLEGGRCNGLNLGDNCSTSQLMRSFIPSTHFAGQGLREKGSNFTYMAVGDVWSHDTESAMR